jgi:hypothetical protein
MFSETSVTTKHTTKHTPEHSDVKFHNCVNLKSRIFRCTEHTPKTQKCRLCSLLPLTKYDFEGEGETTR